MINEIITRVIPYKIKAMCPLCPTGEYFPTGQAYPTNPPLFEHECNECGERIRVRGKQYPQIIYKELEEEEIKNGN